MSLLLLINKENNVNIVGRSTKCWRTITFFLFDSILIFSIDFRRTRRVSNQKYVLIGIARVANLLQNVSDHWRQAWQFVLSCSKIATSYSRLNQVNKRRWVRRPIENTKWLSLVFSSRKLHEIQSELHDQSSVFYMPNLERCNYRANNIIGTDEFLMHQFDLKVLWHIIEEQPPVSRNIKVELKNMKYFLENAGVDFNSSIQLMFDVITQLHEVHFCKCFFFSDLRTMLNNYQIDLQTNSIQTLPHIVKFSELCENRDQFHWIKDTMSKLHETVPMENAIAHQVKRPAF